MRLAGLIFLFTFIGSSYAQSPGYQSLFGKEYDCAINFIYQNYHHFDKQFPDEDDCLVAAAIVFPELIRHNIIKNYIETSVLKALYVQYGSRYADFSVGFFQMKPTFAEKLEKEWAGRERQKVYFTSETGDSAESRSKRVSRLSTLNGQMIYLQMFYELMEDRFSGYEFGSKEEKISMYATAFNSGTDHSYDQLKQLANSRQFHTAVFKIPGTICYSYADIAVDYALRHYLKKGYVIDPSAGKVK